MRKLARLYHERRLDWKEIHPRVRSWIGHAIHGETEARVRCADEGSALVAIDALRTSAHPSQLLRFGNVGSCTQPDQKGPAKSVAASLQRFTEYRSHIGSAPYCKRKFVCDIKNIAPNYPALG